MSHDHRRAMPNPNSTLLTSAIVGGFGIDIPPEHVVPPPGMGVIMLFVPLEKVVGQTAPEVQDDLGLPWSTGDGNGVWLADFLGNT